LLAALVDRLEKQDFLLSELSSRLTALEAAFDSHFPHAADDRLERLNDARKDAEGLRQAICSQYEEIQRLLSQVQD
jgi:hypothetical protein